MAKCKPESELRIFDMYGHLSHRQSACISCPVPIRKPNGYSKHKVLQAGLDQWQQSTLGAVMLFPEMMMGVEYRPVRYIYLCCGRSDTIH